MLIPKSITLKAPAPYIGRRYETCNSMILEICAEDLASCLNAQKGGARRIELCSALDQGGLTPGSGLIQIASQYVTLPIHVLIRPRGGDFVYERKELAVIRREIENCKAMGCEGVVLGALDTSGEIDPRLLEQWVQVAYPMEVTFHRAFDLCADQFEAMEIIAEAGCSRILTSGGAKTCVEGLDRLKELVEAAPEGLEIQAGSGVSPDNIPALHGAGVRNFHMSAREVVPSSVESELFAMERMQSGLDEIKRAVQVLKDLY